MKYFIFSDVHGFYDELTRALDAAGFDINNSNHAIISCGDLLDRGAQPEKCLAFVNNIPDERKILIRGNHEDLLDECIARKSFKTHDYSNGTQATILMLGGLGDRTVTEMDAIIDCQHSAALKQYERDLRDYARVGNFVFVHGWIPTKLVNNPDPQFAKLPDLYVPCIDVIDEDWENGHWSSARWSNGMEMWHRGIIPEGTCVVCGHWHTSFGHAYYENKGVEFPNKYKPELKAYFEPFIQPDICALDGCTAYTHKVSVVVIEDNEIQRVVHGMDDITDQYNFEECM